MRTVRGLARVGVIVGALGALGGVAGCASHRPDVVGPEPRSTDETRWLAPEVRYLASSGVPMFVVDGHTWMWREGLWMKWHGAGWRWAKPPLALGELPSYRVP